MRPPKGQSGYDFEDTLKRIRDPFMFQMHHYHDGFEQIDAL